MNCMFDAGIYPLTCFWATRGYMWRAAYPDVELDVCGATIMFYVPVMRDLILWAGGRDVSRQAIDRAFGEKRSIMLIPGGQREMRHASPDPK